MQITTSARVWIVVASLLGATGVALGAFQAHGLERVLDGQDTDAKSKQKRMENCEVAVRYQMMHAIAVLGAAAILLRVRAKMLNAAAALWTIGTVAFSGPLYLYAIAGSKALIHIVPGGGLMMIVGWVVLGVAALLLRGESAPS